MSLQSAIRFRFAREPAFTLIEVLVVLAVLASLAGIGMAAAQGARSMAEMQRARAELALIAGAIESARTHLGRYPESTDPQVWYGTLVGRRSASGQLLSAPGRCLIETTGLKLALPDEVDPANHLIDPWGRAYLYRPLTGDSVLRPAPFLLYSAGPDGEAGRHIESEPDRTDPATADNLYAFR
ncbi:hypothetical protein MASR2M8_08890 [Opitutaceae bacterium]